MPAIVEEESGKVVTNDYALLVRDFITEWTDFQRTGAPNLYPAEHAAEMEEINDYLYDNVNNGVYRCGFAGTQKDYEDAYRDLWEALDWVEDRLGNQRYLVGDHVTESDIRLFVTLVRFDPVYYGHFKGAIRPANFPTSGATCKNFSSCPDSATPRTSRKSSSTTTSCTKRLTPLRSCQLDQTCRG